MSKHYKDFILHNFDSMPTNLQRLTHKELTLISGGSFLGDLFKGIGNGIAGAGAEIFKPSKADGLFQDARNDFSKIPDDITSDPIGFTLDVVGVLAIVVSLGTAAPEVLGGDAAAEGALEGGDASSIPSFLHNK